MRCEELAVPPTQSPLPCDTVYEVISETKINQSNFHEVEGNNGMQGTQLKHVDANQPQSATGDSRDALRSNNDNSLSVPTTSSHSGTHDRNGNFELYSRNSPRWGGTYTVGTRHIDMTNTCTVDNVFYILLVIVTTRPDLRQEMEDYRENFGNIDLLWCLDMMSVEEWDQAKGYWLQNVCKYDPRENVWDAYGSEESRILGFIEKFQERTWTSTWSSKDCPEAIRRRKAATISLKYVQLYKA